MEEKSYQLSIFRNVLIISSVKMFRRKRKDPCYAISLLRLNKISSVKWYFDRLNEISNLNYL